MDRGIGRDDVDAGARAEDGRGARLQHARVAVGDPAADLVGRRDDERVAHDGAWLQ